MKIKKLISLLLLTFVGASIVMLVVNERSESATSDRFDLPADGVVVVYFHRTKRCDTCNRIEKYTAKSVSANFSDQLKNKSINWLCLNVEDPENLHFRDDFGLTAQHVIVVERKSGKTVFFKDLDQIWDLQRESEEEFSAYIVDEISECLKARKNG